MSGKHPLAPNRTIEEVEMRSPVVLATAALLLASVQGWAASPAKPAPACSGDYGTSIEFDDSPQEAAKRALKEEKLVMVLHVSGHFEDATLT